jgi:Asp-tRNA(Asn)/Glu-tRNA(Gln) amidotransferase A subunit family amidase
MGDSSTLTATQTVAAIRAGELTSESLTRDCLQRIEAREGEVDAWAHLDGAKAIDQARARDDALAAGDAPGLLHGIPVGIKDIYDTADLPTQLGSPLHAGRRPDADAGVVALLTGAGAVILGKTVTTEFALSHPGKTRNPHDPKRTPGGSSSGSAAAVADHMTPLSIGSQTVGSMIRPGSFCGTFAYKPTFGSITRRGMKLLARRLDHVGVYARSVEDLALAGDAVMQSDPLDEDMLAHPGRNLVENLNKLSAFEPERLAFVRSPVWEQADDGAKRAYTDFCAGLGDRMTDLELPAEFDRALEDHHTILNACLASVFRNEYAQTPDRLSDKLKARIEAGIPVSAADYVDAVGRADLRRRLLDRCLANFDAVLTPAAPGEAPEDLTTTGNAAFHAIWTQCGVPAVNVPLLKGAHGMPLGVQLVGPRGDDARVLAAARWLCSKHKPDD